MIADLREQFLAEFTEEKYKAFVKDVHPKHKNVLDFRIAETPIFASKAFKKEMLNLFDDVYDFLKRDDFKDKMKDAIPQRNIVPYEDDYPSFVAIDFAVCKNEQGEFFPQLIEMQGVASLYCYQRNLCKTYQKHYPVLEGLSYYPDPQMTDEKYIQILKNVILGDEKPENVVMLDIKPKYQKTRIDFMYTMRDLGIKPLCITEVIREGRRLYYKWNQRKIPIKRIYNRVIFDELERRTDLDLPFHPTEDLDVKWIAHPNWFFKVSKYSMPFMDSKYVPKTYFLDQLTDYPKDLENYVLKPLYSFAGAGVVFDVNKEVLDKVENPKNYILQKKVKYEPFVKTLDIEAKAEIRMLCVWDKELMPLLTLARLSKGKILGVDFNKDKTWVGSSAVFFEE